jgi:hypothetical protein
MSQGTWRISLWSRWNRAAPGANRRIPRNLRGPTNSARRIRAAWHGRIGLVLIAAALGTALASGIAPAADFSQHPVNQWVLQSPREGQPAPPLKYEGSGALDPQRGTWIHFGGHDGIPQGFYLFTCDLASGRWRQWFPNTSPPGVCCVDGSNTFDVARGRFVAFPGASLGHGYQWSRGVKLKQSHVWLYDPQANRWDNMRPPPYTRPEKYSRDALGNLNSAATYSLRHEVAISFGGQTSGGPTNALFVYDAYANRLEQLRPPEAPSPRDGMGLCYDEANDCLVMFGSQYSDDERTWIYRFSSNRWEGYALDPHPPGRKEGTYATNPKMAYDTANQICLCIVRRGEQSGQPTGSLETWALDVAQLRWKRMAPAREPDASASRARNLSYWPEQNLFVLESVAADHRGPQLWTYRYATPPAAQGPTPPANVQLRIAGSAATPQVELRWDDAGPEVAAYRVYRAESDKPYQAALQRVAQVEGLSYTDASVAPQRVYLYRVAAVDAQGRESPMSRIVRTQPPVPRQPVVSVVDTRRIEVDWAPLDDGDVAGYHVYRGTVAIDTVLRGTPQAWRDNDPQYDEPVVVAVRDITNLQSLNDQPLKSTQWIDTQVDLARPTDASGDYRYAVYAYIVRAVNALGVQSGPSPYGLSIASAPQQVMLREQGSVAHLRWEPNPERGVVGYHVYKLGRSHWEIERVTEKPIAATEFQHEAGRGTTRYWVVPVDVLGQLGEPSSPVWFNQRYEAFFDGPWHQ